MRICPTQIIISLSLLMFSSCRNISPKVETDVAGAIINMTGKQVVFAPTLLPTILGRDTTINVRDTVWARLIVYYDSTACQTCRVNTLYEWKDIISLEKKTSGKFEMMMVFAPSARDVKNLLRALARSRFLHPVYLDIGQKMLTANPYIPPHQAFHTFLVDGNNSIILVGDPIVNPKLYPLFTKTLENLLRNQGRFVEGT